MNGTALPGLAPQDCPPHFGDAVEGGVLGKNGGDVSFLATQPVRRRFGLKDADVYAFQLLEPPPPGYGTVPFYWWLGDPLTKARLGGGSC